MEKSRDNILQIIKEGFSEETEACVIQINYIISKFGHRYSSTEY